MNSQFKARERMDRCTRDTEHFLSRFDDLTRETAAHATQVFHFLMSSFTVRELAKAELLHLIQGKNYFILSMF